MQELTPHIVLIIKILNMYYRKRRGQLQLCKWYDSDDYDHSLPSAILMLQCLLMTIMLMTMMMLNSQ
jgi:hypothetical protein